uniref:Uncharacterized protein n=1 Tax=Rhizophora mucronata TaxID=61149 RepID=A0A2P2R1K7_RHIMU
MNLCPSEKIKKKQQPIVFLQIYINLSTHPMFDIAHGNSQKRREGRDINSRFNT